MPPSVSFMAYWRDRKRSLSLWFARHGKRVSLAYTSVCWLLFGGIGHAYTVIEISTGAPAGIEAQLIAQTTTQFNATVVPNPFFPNTYQIEVFGENTSYNPPVTSAQLLQQINMDAQYMATVDSSTFINGFADGMAYQQSQEENLVSYYAVNCSTPTLFNLSQTSTTTFDSNTCGDVATTIDEALFQLSQSSPIVIPPEP